MEKFNVTLEEVYFDGYCQYKECYGGLEMQVYNKETGTLLSEISDEECFEFSGYKQMVWMSDLDSVVKNIMGQTIVQMIENGEGLEATQEEYDELELDIKTKIKSAIVDRTIAEWYSEPDYVSGWDEIEVAEMA
jgi:hypothetical protein